MKENKNLVFLHEVAKKISDMSKRDLPITKEEVFDVFKQTLERVTTIGFTCWKLVTRLSAHDIINGTKS